MTSQEAEKKVLEARPGFRIVKTTELQKCFVVNVVPEKYNEKDDGLYIGGAMRVDKKTGDLNLYNPMIEEMR